MWSVIIGALQIVFLLLKNKLERDEEIKKKKEALREEATSAIKAGDLSRINGVINKLRK